MNDGSVVGFFRYVQKGAPTSATSLCGAAPCPPAAAPPWAALRAATPAPCITAGLRGVSSGASIVGGIVGTNLASGVIESCTTTGSVYGAHFIGGIAGENHGIIANCTNTASVNTTVEQNDIDLSR